MGTELERRFLIDLSKLQEMTDYFNSEPNKVIKDIKQGYLSSNSNGVVRVRYTAIHKDVAEQLFGYITVKGPRINGACKEFEYSIPPKDVEELLESLPTEQVITKQRTVIPLVSGSFTFKLEFDVFHGSNSGLIILEVELDNFDDLDPSILPSFVGKEITGKEDYSNASLSKTPYSSW